MRDLIQVQYCDVCWLSDDGAEPVDATESWTIGIVVGDRGRPVPKVLDLCSAHAGPISDLAALMGSIHQIADDPLAVKRSPGRPRKDPAAIVREHPMKPCPVCGLDTKNNIMVAHIWQRHRDDLKPPIPKDCPECGDHIESPQAMAQHRRSIHHFDAVAEALAGVKGYNKPGRKAKAPKAIENGQPQLVAEAG